MFVGLCIVFIRKGRGKSFWKGNDFRVGVEGRNLEGFWRLLEVLTQLSI